MKQLHNVIAFNALFRTWLLNAFFICLDFIYRTSGHDKFYPDIVNLDPKISAAPSKENILIFGLDGISHRLLLVFQQQCELERTYFYLK